MPEVTRQDGPVLQEIAAEDDLDALFQGYVDEIRLNTDPVLISLGGQLKEYSKLLKDHQVKSLFQQRQDALVGFETIVEPGGTTALDRKAADSLKAMIKAIRWDDKTRKMLMGVFYGYSVGEFLWARDGREVFIDALKVRKCWRFGFGREGELRLRKTLSGTEAMPDRKFWVSAFGADDDDSPYGLGLAHHLWWPVFLKRNGAKFWALFLDKFGAPSAKATYPNNAKENEKHTALEAAKMLRSMGATAFPAGFDVQLIEATGNGKGTFESFMKYWDEAVAKLVLGQAGTSTIGPYTGTAGVHNKVRMDIIRCDADLSCESFNTGPARWLTDWNYPGAAYPRVWRDIPDLEAKKARVDQDRKLYAMGYELTEKAVLEEYGDRYRKRKAPASGHQGASARFAEGQFAERADEVDVLTDQLDDLSMDAMGQMIDRVRHLTDEVSDLGELKDRLLEVYTDMDETAAAELLARAMAVSCLKGMDA